MIHGRLPPPVADRLIERIARRLPAEQVAIGRAETLDRRFVEQGFGRREQLQRLGGAKAALVGRIEAASAFDLVAEEIDTQAGFLAGGDQVEDAARSEEHMSELQSLMRISYAVFCVKIIQHYKHNATD